MFLGSLSIDRQGNATGRVDVPGSIASGPHVLQITTYVSDARVIAVSIGALLSARMELDRGTRTPQGRADRIRTTGLTAGLEPGTRLTPWIR